MSKSRLSVGLVLAVAGAVLVAALDGAYGLGWALVVLGLALAVGRWEPARAGSARGGSRSG